MGEGGAKEPGRSRVVLGEKALSTTTDKAINLRLADAAREVGPADSTQRARESRVHGEAAGQEKADYRETCTARRGRDGHVNGTGSGS